MVTNKTVINRLAILVKNGLVVPNMVKERIRSYELFDYTKQNEKEIQLHHYEKNDADGVGNEYNRCYYLSISFYRIMSELLYSESIIKIGGGRYTKYVWNREKEQ